MLSFSLHLLFASLVSLQVAIFICHFLNFCPSLSFSALPPLLEAHKRCPLHVQDRMCLFRVTSSFMSRSSFHRNLFQLTSFVLQTFAVKSKYIDQNFDSDQIKWVFLLPLIFTPYLTSVCFDKYTNLLLLLYLLVSKPLKHYDVFFSRFVRLSGSFC